MGDSYVESIVARDKNTLDATLKIVCYVLAGICVVLGLKMTVLLIAAIVFVVLGVFLVPNPEIEFEYTYIDRELRVDKIIAKSKRKSVATYDLSKMEIMCPENSHEFDSYRNRKLPGKNYSSLNPDVKPYIMVYHDEKTLSLVALEPVPEIIRAIKCVYPRKVIEY